MRGSSANGFEEEVGRYSSRDSTASSSEGGQKGGYEAFMDGRKGDAGGMRWVPFTSKRRGGTDGDGGSGTLRRKSMNLGRNLAGSVGGFLPGAVTGMWDPQRDFAFLKLPTAGVRSVVALSAFVFPSLFSSV